MGREAAVMDWEQKFPFLREKGHVVSLIGGGGKTTLLYALSAYCMAKGWRADGDDDAYSEAGKCAVDCGK